MPKVVDKLIEEFWSPSGRDLAYQSLLGIAHDKKNTENKEAILFLLSVLSCLKDKGQVEDLLYTVLRSRNSELKCDILFFLGPYFRYFSDKNKAWSILHKLTLSRNIYIKEAVAFSIGPAFAFIPDKEQAMKDLFRLVKCFDEEIQENAVKSLGFAFPFLSDKNKAWNFLFQIAMSGNYDEGLAAANSLRYAFPHVPYKSWAWKDMLEIIDSDIFLCSSATASSLFHSYQWYPKKLSGYDDLISLTTHKNKEVQNTSIFSIGMIFSHIPDKERGQKDLISLLNSDNIDCKDNVLISLGNAFSHLPDKIKVWKILHEYVNSNNASLRKGAAFAIGDACPHLPFPEDCFNDLYMLASDESSSVRMAVAYSLGFIYPNVKKNNHVFSCLQTLSDDGDSYVRMRANYSLGKICIYEAARTKEKKDLEDLLEKTVNYFEKATNEECHFNPATFCYLFYRSFDAIFFKKRIMKEEIERFIIDAKEEAEDSINKSKLIEVIEQLSTVLYVAKGSQDIDFESTVEVVEFCRQHCNYAEVLMDETKGTAPNLNQVFHNVMPLFNRNIKELIDDVKEKAEAACKEAKGTVAQQVICEINREIQELIIGSQDYMIKQVQTLYTNLKSSVPDKEEYRLIHQEIDSILNEDDLVNQYSSLNMLLPKIIQINVVEATASVSDEIRILRESVDKLTKSVDELQNPQEYLDTILKNLEAIKNEIPEMKKQIDDVLYELYSPAGIDQKLKIAIPIIPLLATYEVETNPSKFVVDRIFELKKLIMGSK